MARAQKIKAQIQLEEIEPIEVPAKVLPEYEKLTYKAKYLGITVGTMVAEIKGITTIQGRQAYHFELSATTTPFFSKIFHVDDRFVSYMDIEKRHVLRQEIYRKEGNYKKESIVDFDQENHKAYYQHLLNGTSEVIDIPENVQDVVTTNYYFRMVNFQLGDTLEYKVYVDEKVYDLLVLISDQKKLRVPGLGRQDTFVIQPFAELGGEDIKKGRGSAYFSIEESRLPFKAEVDTPLFGNASVMLYEKEEELYNY